MQRASCLRLLLTSGWMRYLFHISTLAPLAAQIVIVRCYKGYNYEAFSQLSALSVFMNAAAVAYLNESSGWEVGVGPSIVVVDTRLRDQQPTQRVGIILDIRIEPAIARPN